MIPARELKGRRGRSLVWILTASGPRQITLAEARRAKEDVLQCALCDNPAWVLDHLAGYHKEENRCRACARKERRKMNERTEPNWLEGK